MNLILISYCKTIIFLYKNEFGLWIYKCDYQKTKKKNGWIERLNIIINKCLETP